MYIERELERKFLKMNAAFKAILITGARQVGKTTMLKHLAAEQKRTFISMDDVRNRELAQRDPKLFFQMFQPPILIDEVQKAPELFECIKEICDSSEEKGLFWLTGSESKKLLKNAGDSLAGRICILKMYSLSQREKAGLASLGAPDFSFPSLLNREKAFTDNNINDVYEHIWRGGMPGAQQYDEEQLAEFYNSYIETYLMRDAVDDNGITDTIGFRKVLTACAAFIGNMVNYSDIANAGGVSVPTAKNWLNVLQNMGIIFLLPAYANNELKRLVKTPKLYFCDTGLAAFLSMWTTKNVLMNGAASGHYFENYVVGELLRGYAYSSSKTHLSFYRDVKQREIDVIAESNGIAYPLEIKRTTNPDRKLVQTFDILKVTTSQIGMGAVICMTDRVFPIDAQNILIPANII